MYCNAFDLMNGANVNMEIYILEDYTTSDHFAETNSFCPSLRDVFHENTEADLFQNKIKLKHPKR